MLEMRILRSDFDTRFAETLHSGEMVLLLLASVMRR